DATVPNRDGHLQRLGNIVARDSGADSGSVHARHRELPLIEQPVPVDLKSEDLQSNLAQRDPARVQLSDRDSQALDPAVPQQLARKGTIRSSRKDRGPAATHLAVVP